MIAKGDFVRISFTAKLEDGSVIDTTDEKTAKEFGIYNENTRYGDVYIIVGEKQIVEGLDEDIVGKEVGYKGSVLLPPEKAFGKYDPKNKDAVAITKFSEKPEVGQRVRVGNKIGIVERIVGRRVIVDFNHPLAGKNVLFEYEIKEKVEKPEDKVKAIFLIHSGVEVKDVRLDGNRVIIEVPKEAYFSQMFLIGKYRAAQDIFKFLNAEEVEMIERIKKEDFKQEKTEEKPEAQEPKTES